MAKCNVCGRPLTDPVSIARGTGPVCSGTASNGRTSQRARRYQNKVKRGRAYASRRPFSIPSQPIIPILADEYRNEWWFTRAGIMLTHEELGRYLKKKRLVVIEEKKKRPAPNQTASAAPEGAIT